MRPSGTWMQLYLKLGARARCDRLALHILPVSDIFLAIRGLCRWLRLPRRLKPFTRFFSGLYQPAIWIKELWFEDLCLVQPREGSKAAPGVYGVVPYKTYRFLGVQRSAE